MNKNKKRAQKKVPLRNRDFLLSEFFAYPNLLILSSRLASRIFIFRPSIAITFSLAKVDNVRMAFEVVIFDKLAMSSLER